MAFFRTCPGVWEIRFRDTEKCTTVKVTHMPRVRLHTKVGCSPAEGEKHVVPCISINICAAVRDNSQTLARSSCSSSGHVKRSISFLFFFFRQIYSSRVGVRVWASREFWCGASGINYEKLQRKKKKKRFVWEFYNHARVWSAAMIRILRNIFSAQVLRKLSNFLMRMKIDQFLGRKMWLSQREINFFSFFQTRLQFV